MESLYERIGGEAAVMAAVALFYKKVLEDDLTRPFFAGLDIDGQIKKQLSFMTWAFGGPDAYRGRPLREAHAKLVSEQGLSDQHFDAVAGHLRATLDDLGVAGDIASEVMAKINALRGEVLSR